MKAKTLYLRAGQLDHHPENMRRMYVPEEVAEMATSIRTCHGVIHPLLVVRAAKPNRYLVVDGNVRLEGARALGQDCPLLECRVCAQSEAEQLLAMAVSNGVRFKVNPIDEARHYHSLIHDQGLKRDAIAQAIGKPTVYIANLLVWLRLEPEIQALVAAGKLPKDARVARALLVLPPATRVSLAQRLEGATLKAILSAVKALADKQAQRRARRLRPGDAAPALGLACRVKSRRATKEDPAEPGPAGHQPTADQVYSWPQLRAEARHACAACAVKADTLSHAGEPAWALLSHKAGEVCGDCSLRDISSACEACGLVDFLRRLVRQSAQPPCASTR